MEDDRDYYRRRAEEELEAAQASREPTAVRAHYLLANHYLTQIDGMPENGPPMAFHLVPSADVSAFVKT